MGWMFVVLGVCIWLLFQPEMRKVGRLLLVVVVSWLFLPIADGLMNLAGDHFLWKFDYSLYNIDKSLGLTSFVIARHVSGWSRLFLLAVYQSLLPAMYGWFAVNLERTRGKPYRLLVAYVVLMLAGPLLFTIVPGRGPRHAFGTQFPNGSPVVPFELVKLHGWPNAMPSVHLATALLFVLYAGKNRILQGIAWTYLVLTILATLAFEHYLIDLIVAVPFACFAAKAAEGRFRASMLLLALVLAWLSAIRFAAPQLASEPYFLRVLAVSTIAVSVVVVRRPAEAPVLYTPRDCPADSCLPS